MAKGSRSNDIFAAAFAILLVWTSAPGRAAVGRTPGSFNVSNTGAATYSIPIFTPPGPRGVQPSVALAYNSAGGPGIVGRGWSLAGFSSITRCAKTIAQDGAGAGQVLLATTDAYCMDGKRLRYAGGSSYGTGGSVYMTEVADFSRVTAIGAPSWESGPESWSVEHKDGLIYTYGGSTDSRISVGSQATAGAFIALVWKLSEIRDRSGNKIRFTWSGSHGDLAIPHPLKVEWTQTSANSGSYVNSMEFDYAANGNAPISTPTDRMWYYDMRDPDLLTSITVKVSGVLKRKYFLTYNDSLTTGAKRIEKVEECVSSIPSPADCLAPTVITSQESSGGIHDTPALDISGNITDATGEYDFDGNGRKDIAYKISGAWYIRLAQTTGGYGSEITTGVSTETMAAGKLLGDAADQFMGVSGGTWYVYAWNGSSFSATSTGMTTSASSTNITVADLNVDGLDDLAYVSIYGQNTSQGYYHVPQVLISTRRNVSSGGSISFGSPVATMYSWPTVDLAEPPLFGDWAWDYYYYWDCGIDMAASDVTLTKGGKSTGDGRVTLNLNIRTNVSYYPLSSPTSLTYLFSADDRYIVEFSSAQQAYVSKLAGYYGWADAISMPGDFNNDGCDDFVIHEYDPYAYLTIMMVGFSGCGGYMSYAMASTDNDYRFPTGVADISGDGIDDFGYSNGTYATIAYWNGSEFISTIGFPGSVIFGTDGNGDGFDDIGVLISGSNLKVYNHYSSLHPDLASKIEDGFGVKFEPTYESIANSSSYYPYANGYYPTRDVRRDLVMVTNVAASDGAGGTFNTTYKYSGAKMNLQGRGFLGFEKVESQDLRTGIKHERVFDTQFPRTGMLLQDNLYQSDNTPIRLQTNTLSVMSLDATTYNQREFPYVSSSIEDSYEVGGTKNGSWIARSQTSITPDLHGNVTASSRTITDKDIDSPLYDHAWVSSVSADFTSANTGYWCLGLPTASEVTHSTTVGGESAVTRRKSFSPDYEKCRMDAESVEPLSITLRVDTSYGYDSFGNVSSVSVTGRNPNGSSMSTRTATTGWGTTGQFPVSNTDAVSETNTRTFDPTFGKVLTETNQNGLVDFYGYDDFGNLTSKVYPDGTHTYYWYAWCADYNMCLNGDASTGGDLNRTVMQTLDYDTSDVSVREVWQYFDQFGREIIHLDPSAYETYSGVGRVYDAMGRVARESAPCGAPCVQYWTTNTYDLLGRLIERSRPTSDSSSTPVTMAFAYAGRRQTVTDPNSKVTTKVMDVNGWMRRSRDHDNYGQNFSYDAAGSLISVTDTASNALFSASYVYGIRPFQYQTTDMDLGTWSYTHNSLGELVFWQDANTNSFSQTYDILGRVTSRTEPEGTTYWTWGDGTPTGTANKGRLASVSMTANAYSEALTYDNKGRLSRRAVTADGSTYNIDFTYNNQGLPDTLTYPESTSGTRVKVKYGYAQKVLQSVTDWTSGSAGTVYWAANHQNARGQTTQETLGNGVVTNRSFDAVTGWLNSIESGVSGGTGLQNQSYLYDAVGNVTQRQAYIGLTPLTESFFYDNLHRLDHSTWSDGGVASTNLDLEYDATGNITSKMEGGVTKSYAYGHPTKKHAVTGFGSATYSYDANGNMTSRDGSTINWSSFNYPTYLATGTENTTFYYGPDRQYYRQDYNGPSSSETTYYVGGILEKVCPSTSCLSGTIDWRHYIVAEGETVAIVSRKSSGTNTVNYMLEDNQGSISTVADSSGGPVVRESYAAFGGQRDGDDWDGPESSGDLTTIEGITRRGYTGHTMLGRMGLIHMNGRVQDSLTGRFLSADPYIPDPSATQSFNRYAYVMNNPLSFTDPSGFIPREQCSWVPRMDWMFDWYYYRPTPRGPIQLLEPTGNFYLAPTGESVRVCWTVDVPEPEPEEEKSLAKREERRLQQRPQSQAEGAKLCRNLALADTGAEVPPWVRGVPSVWDDPSQLQFHLKWATEDAEGQEALGKFLDFVPAVAALIGLKSESVSKVMAARKATVAGLYAYGVEKAAEHSGSVHRTEAGSIAARIAHLNAIRAGWCAGQ